MEFPYEEDVLTRIEDASGRFSYRFVADVNALDSQCRTALYLAVANSHFDVVKYLLEVNLSLFFLSLHGSREPNQNAAKNPLKWVEGGGVINASSAMAVILFRITFRTNMSYLTNFLSFVLFRRGEEECREEI